MFYLVHYCYNSVTTFIILILFNYYNFYLYINWADKRMNEVKAVGKKWTQLNFTWYILYLYYIIFLT